MSLLEKIGNYKRWRYKKLRLLLAWTGGILLVIFSQITDESLRLSVWFLLLGEAIRILSLGYIERKGQKLANAGPYAYTRNPLYVGNFFLGLGAVIGFGNPVMLVLFAVGYAILYRGTINGEEQDLEEKFGEVYRDYKASVPRLLPQLKPYPRRSDIRYNWRNLLKNREYVTVLGLGLLVSGMYLAKGILGRHEFDLSMKIALGFAVLFAVSLVVERVTRK